MPNWKYQTEESIAYDNRRYLEQEVERLGKKLDRISSCNCKCLHCMNYEEMPENIKNAAKNWSNKQIEHAKLVKDMINNRKNKDK